MELSKKARRLFALMLDTGSNAATLVELRAGLAELDPAERAKLLRAVATAQKVQRLTGRGPDRDRDAEEGLNKFYNRGREST